MIEGVPIRGDRVRWVDIIPFGLVVVSRSSNSLVRLLFRNIRTTDSKFKFINGCI